jgi:hypothetical protein
MALNDLKRYEKSVEYCSKVIELDLTDSMAYYNKDIAFVNLKRVLDKMI